MVHIVALGRCGVFFFTAVLSERGTPVGVWLETESAEVTRCAFFSGAVLNGVVVGCEVFFLHLNVASGRSLAQVQHRDRPAAWSGLTHPWLSFLLKPS